MIINQDQRDEVIAAMKKWCLDNYENGADTMVECWSDSDYHDLLDECGNDVVQAESILKSVASIYQDRQADADSYREEWHNPA